MLQEYGRRRAGLAGLRVCYRSTVGRRHRLTHACLLCKYCTRVGRAVRCDIDWQGALLRCYCKLVDGSRLSLPLGHAVSSRFGSRARAPSVRTVLTGSDAAHPPKPSRRTAASSSSSGCCMLRRTRVRASACPCIRCDPSPTAHRLLPSPNASATRSDRIGLARATQASAATAGRCLA